MEDYEYRELINLRETVKKQEKQIQEFKDQIEKLTQMVIRAQKKQFGASNRKTSKIEGQMSLFNEAGNKFSGKLGESTIDTLTFANTFRKPRKLGVKKEMLKNIPKEVVECTLEEKDVECPYCRTIMQSIGKSVVRTEIEFVPATVKAIEYVQYVYKCPECGIHDSSNAVLVKAPVPKPVMKRSLASSSTVAEVIYQKYVNGIALYRQENKWLQHGIHISRSTMANWVIRCSQDWLKPIYDIMKNKLIKCAAIQTDEARIQCNNDPENKALIKSYIRMYCSGESENIAIVLYEYIRTHANKHVRMFQKEFNGYFMTGSYDNYEKMNNNPNKFYSSHVSHYYSNSFPINKKKEISGSREAEEYQDQLFKINHNFTAISPNECRSKCQKQSTKNFDRFWCWDGATSEIVTKNKKKEEDIIYLKNKRKYFEIFLEKGCILTSNNLKNSPIHVFNVGRHGWFFADTPKGAEASAIAYSIVESAKANNLNVFQYLKHLLKNMPNIDFKTQPNLLEDYLPWSEKLPECCRLQEK